MKVSRNRPKSSPPAVQAVMQFVDDEISKIVADIASHRPLRPSNKPRGSRSKHAHDRAHAA